MEAGWDYHRYLALHEAAIILPSNPCTRIILEMRNDLLIWWDAVRHLVFSRHPLASQGNVDLHLITDVITAPKTLIHYQQSGYHDIGLGIAANTSVPGGVASAGTTFNKDVATVHSTCAISQTRDPGNYVIFMTTLTVKRKRIWGLNWATRVFQYPSISPQPL